MYIVIVLMLTIIVLAAAITQIGYLQITRMRVKNDLKLFKVLETAGLYSREQSLVLRLRGVSPQEADSGNPA